MGTARDLAASTLVDSILPYLHRALEDVVYQVLDQRRVPTRTDHQELERRHASAKSDIAALKKRVAALEATLEAVKAE